MINKRVKCAYCGKEIHISKWAGVSKKGFICDDINCLQKVAEEIKLSEKQNDE